jgi:hypothetical protein
MPRIYEKMLLVKMGYSPLPVGELSYNHTKEARDLVEEHGLKKMLMVNGTDHAHAVGTVASAPSISEFREAWEGYDYQGLSADRAETYGRGISEDFEVKNQHKLHEYELFSVVMARMYGEAEEYQGLDEETEAQGLRLVRQRLAAYQQLGSSICEWAATSGEELKYLYNFMDRQARWTELEQECDEKGLRLGLYIDRACTIFFCTHEEAGKILNAVAVTERQNHFLALLEKECDRIRADERGIVKWHRLAGNSIKPSVELANLTELSIGGEISDLAPLANLANLKKLSLTSKKISDLSPLAGLNNLTVLVAQDNNISDLSPLSKLQNLTELTILRNPVDNLRPLAGLNNLTKLKLHNLQAKDLSPLRGLTKLAELELLGYGTDTDINIIGGLTNLTQLQTDGDFFFRDIGPLGNLTNLTSLYLYDGLPDLSPLGKLVNLRRLHLQLWSGNIRDLRPLEQLTNLTHLELYVYGEESCDLSALSHLTDLTYLHLRGDSVRDLSPLYSLTNLTELRLECRYISEKEQNALAAAMPNIY